MPRALHIIVRGVTPVLGGRITHDAASWACVQCHSVPTTGTACSQATLDELGLPHDDITASIAILKLSR